MEKVHVITDFIKKGFETGTIDMMTDGTEEREFYTLKIAVKLKCHEEHTAFTSDDQRFHITSGISTSILEIARQIQLYFGGEEKEVKIGSHALEG